ncbi:hypothetical protein N7474_006951 [Penicillium riverlandense]|uniref:uncharacterized protein n=1 Tax=Penicillium riverlandense TaxID=1903569 RepID=UPI002548F7DF|nr:uncharacterized protein N7474_006951 [Penicillium riverlandense]KAJ5815174.1 hypothetical protein N7474_006951 [Penicillium riverlandense]
MGLPVNTADLPNNGHILDSLPHSTSEYEYRGKKRFWDTIDAELNLFMNDKVGARSQYVVFSHLDEHKFLKDINSEGFKYFDSYDAHSKILLIKMPTKAHEQISRKFVSGLVVKLSRMKDGLQDELHEMGSADVDLTSRRKQPDQSFCPVTLPPSRSDKFPTMIIEAAFSESKTKLRSNTKLWLVESKGDVKIALIMSTSKKRKEVTFELWQTFGRATRNEPGKIVAELKQTVTVEEHGGHARASGKLTIPFEDLFLRSAVLPEEDIVFTERDVVKRACQVWAVQKF